MAIQIKFDGSGTPELPTMILATRNGTKLGQINGYGVVIAGNLNSASEIQFEIDKYDSYGNVVNIWDEIKDFRLLWCKEWDMWFEMTVELDETTEITKTVFCTQLGHAELSQIYLYDIEINTEDDILRDDYTRPTVLYDPDHPEASLLNRITEHAPHYKIEYVDYTIENIQRTFSFDDITIYDAFLEIEDEIGCIFILDSGSNADGSINRTIKVYDLESYCRNCGYRGEYTGTCPECGSTDINEGYGKDTTIYVDAEELADEIQYSTDTGSVKNCFKLVGGDDLMTATIRNCNPNGSDRLWYFSEDTLGDMSEELVQAIAAYNEQYDYYLSDYIVNNIPSSLRTSYNNLVTKYQAYNEDIATLPSTITGYSALMEAYYNTIDFALYLESELMPNVSLSDTSASAQAALLTANNFGDVAVADVSSISSSSADNAVLAMAKVIVDSRYQVKIASSSYGSGQRWTGNFTVTNYSDEEDTATSNTITLTITDDYEEYLRQMIDKELNKLDSTDYSIVGLFELDYDDFCEELKKYCRDSLSAFYNAGQACLNILIEQGIGDKETWGSDEVDADSNLYEKLYLPYYNKEIAVEAELKLREEEIAIIQGTYDENGYADEYGVQTYLIEARNGIQGVLDFEDYLGKDLWLEFSAFRREDKYENDNYISDGLNNAELFANADEFIEVATKELYKSAELQHSIASTLKNLLAIDKFAPLVEYFEVGNWLRIRVDGSVFKLRLIGYEIDYDDLSKLSVDFSDVMKTMDGMSDKKSIIEQAASMASSYDSVKRQTSLGSKAYEVTDNWFKEGLDITNVKLISSAENEEISWDSSGLLFRKYDPILERYEDEQMKIIHSTLAVTSDNWETVRTAVGGFYYVDPETGEQKYAYGINGELLVGHLVLGENLAFYNDSGTLKFDDDGLLFTNGTNTFKLDMNSERLLVISNDKTGEDIFYLDKDGNAVFSGSGTFSGALQAASGTFTGTLQAATGSFSGWINADEGYVGGWTIGEYKIYGGEESNGTCCVMQVPRDRDATSGRYWVFAAGGYSHNNYSDCPFRVGSNGETHTQELLVGELDETNESNCVVRNVTGRIDLQVSAIGNKGLYDVDTGHYIVHKSTDGDNRLGNTDEPTRINGSTINVSGTIMNPLYIGDSSVDSLTVVRTTNEYGSVQFGVSVNGNKGIYDVTFEKWLIYSNSSGTIVTDSSLAVVSANDADELDSDLSTLAVTAKDSDSKFLSNLTPRTYKVEGKKHVGFTVNDVESAMEEAGMNPDDYDITEHWEEDGKEIGAIRYEEIIPMLVNEIQNLKSEINELKSQA